MTDQEILQLREEIAELLETMVIPPIQQLQEDVSGLKQDVSSLKQDVSSLKQDMQEVKSWQVRADHKFTLILDRLDSAEERDNRYNRTRKDHEKRIVQLEAVAG